MKQNAKPVTGEQMYATGYKASDLCAGVCNITQSQRHDSTSVQLDTRLVMCMCRLNVTTEIFW